MNPLDILFPKRCLGCRKWGRYICSSCQQKIKPLPYLKCPVCEKPAIDGMTHPRCKTTYSLDGLTSFFRYEGIVKKAIKSIKYRYTYDVTHELIQCIPSSSLEFFHTSCFINLNSKFVPIPLHTSRFNFRGFNQAEIIAGALGKRLNIPVHASVLVRTKKTIPQVEMKDKDKRLANMNHVFSVKNSQSVIRNCPILLVDDVFTTGATLRSAASVLKHAGFPHVWGVTLAQ